MPNAGLTRDRTRGFGMIGLRDILVSSASWPVKGRKMADWLVGRLLLPFIGASVPTPLPLRDRSRIRNILLIRPGGIGDAVWVIPLIRQILEAFPAASIDLLAERRNAEVFSALDGEVRRCVRYDDPFWRWWPALKKASYDLILDTEQWHQMSAVTAGLLGAPIRVGFDTNPRRNRCYTIRVPYRQEDFEGESFLRMLAALTGRPASFDWSRPFLPIPEEAAKWAAEQLPPGPVASAAVRGSVPERCWEPEKFEELFSGLTSKGLTVCLLGGGGDAACAGRICRTLPPGSAVNLVGKTSLLQSAAVLRHSRLFVGTDSGLMHLAFAVGTPAVALFGAGIEAKWALHVGRNRILNRRLACSPCTRFGCTPPCPIQVRCLREISAGEALMACSELIGAAA